MKVFVNGYTPGYTRPIIAYIDNTVIHEETWDNGYVYREREIDIQQIKNICKAINLMGVQIEKIMILANYFDTEDECFRGVDKETINKICFNLKHGGQEVIIGRSRIYAVIDNKKIMLPKEMICDYDKHTLCVEFHIKS